MDTRVRMAGSLRCSPETVTTLFIGCTLIQNKKFKTKGKRKSTYCCVLFNPLYLKYYHFNVQLI